MALTNEDKAELASLIGAVVDAKIEKALDGDERRVRPIILPGDPPLPTADDLLSHFLAPVFAARVFRLTIETKWDDEKGQVIIYNATRDDDAVMKPLTTSPHEPFERVLEQIAERAKALPKDGVLHNPNDPSTKPLSEEDKDRIRGVYKKEIDSRFRGGIGS